MGTGNLQVTRVTGHARLFYKWTIVVWAKLVKSMVHQITNYVTMRLRDILGTATRKNSKTVETLIINGNRIGAC
jgi:hypothetical protein